MLPNNGIKFLCNAKYVIIPKDCINEVKHFHINILHISFVTSIYNRKTASIETIFLLHSKRNFIITDGKDKPFFFVGQPRKVSRNNYFFVCYLGTILIRLQYRNWIILSH